MNNLTRFNGLIKQDKVMEKKAAQEMSDLFGSIAPSRYDACHLTICLDGSGSVWDLVEETKAAYSQLETEFPNVSRVELVFNDRIMRLNSIQEFRAAGNTAMRDSILAGIEVTRAEIGHDNVIFVITSDGDDNASKATVAEVRQAIDEMKIRGWQFFAIFLQKKQGIAWQGSAKQQVFESLGLESISEESVKTAIQKLSDGIYGYLETGVLRLPETT